MAKPPSMLEENALLKDCAAVFRDALAYQDMVACMFAIPADDVFVSGHGGQLLVVVRHAGLEFVINVGKHPLDEAAFATAWREVVDAWNASPQSKRDEIVQKSRVRGHATALAAAMIEKGFRRPSVESGSLH